VSSSGRGLPLPFFVADNLRGKSLGSRPPRRRRRERGTSGEMSATPPTAGGQRWRLGQIRAGSHGQRLVDGRWARSAKMKRYCCCRREEEERVMTDRKRRLSFGCSNLFLMYYDDNKISFDF
jgi:hypothetical protein